MTEKEELEQLIINYPKHYASILRSNVDNKYDHLLKWINLNTLSDSEFIPEKIYSAINNESNICENGNKRVIKSYPKGWQYCGSAKSCICAKRTISNKCKAAWANFTVNKIKSIVENRISTVKSLYNVDNVGKLQSAINARSEFYKDIEKVNGVTTKVKNTKKERYGNENYRNDEKIKETCLKKYGVDNGLLLTKNNSNLNLTLLKNKDTLLTLFPRLGVNEIASELGVSTTTVYRYLSEHNIRDPYKSTFELEICEYLNSLGITNIETNRRNIIGKELDIFLPDYNLAIEYNGEIWHHDQIGHIDKKYHQSKFLLCESKGIELLTIFGLSWKKDKELWKEKFKAKLQLSHNKVYARKTSIVKLLAKETKDILTKNHVQGYTTAEYCYGLMYENKLVALMTFSSKRPGIGKDRGNDAYELVRYVTNINVVGGASKLLSYFIKQHSPKLIYSYSNNQYSVGKLYKVLGFSLESDNPPSYSYYNPKEQTIKHRYNFTKHKLVKQGYDSSKTEFQIMNDLGYLRIWDCGTRTWVLNLENK